MKRFLVCSAVLLLSAGLLAADSSEEPGGAAKQAPRDVPAFHNTELTGLVIKIRSMYLREDHEAIRPELARLNESCRLLYAEDKLVYGDQVVSFDRGLHRALDRTRELAADGKWADSEKQYEWVLRTCTRCHQTAREEGFGPPLPLP